jgi:hypothetical protein
MSRADILKGTLFVQRNTQAGISGIWEEKYAVLASTHLAYYNSGTHFVSNVVTTWYRNKLRRFDAQTHPSNAPPIHYFLAYTQWNVQSPPF